jgi:hypothetical protein
MIIEITPPMKASWKISTIALRVAGRKEKNIRCL